MDRSDWQDEERRIEAYRKMERELRAPACPTCGSQRIVEWNSVHVAHPILRLDDQLQPDDYGVAEVAWETSEPLGGPDIYECRTCGHEFADFEHLR